MSKKKKIISWLIVFFIWNSAVVGFHIFMRSQLEFPTLNFESLGWFAWSIPIFMTVPFYGLFFGILSVYRKKLMKAFAVLFTVVGIFAFLGFVVISTNLLTDWTPGIYPLMSETENASDYLVLDGNFKDNYDNIIEVMPEKIPQEAENVRYEYIYDPCMSGNMEVYFELPENEYETFKSEVMEKQAVSEETESDNSAYFAWNVTEIPAFFTWMRVDFDDSKNSVYCVAHQIYCD